MTAVLFFKFGNKNPKKIKQIVITIKIVSLVKCTNRTKINLIIIAKIKQFIKLYLIKSKINKKYFNYKKKGYYIKECLFSAQKKLEKLAKKAKYAE